MNETQRIIALRAALALVQVRAGQSRDARNAWSWGEALNFLEQHAKQALLDDDMAEKQEATTTTT